MFWVVLFVGIALAGLAMVVGYAVWLAHLGADVLSEVAVLARRGGQLATLLAEISPPTPGMRAFDESVVVATDVARNRG